MDIDVNLPIRINGMLYKQIITDDINKDDLVLDTKDGTYAHVVSRYEDNVTIQEGGIGETHVPVSRLRKLQLTAGNPKNN